MLLSLIDGLDREQFRPMSILPEHGPMEQELCRREVPFTIMDLRPSIGRIAMAAAVVRLVKLIAKGHLEKLPMLRSVTKSAEL